jgi:hypothetical protein
MKGNWTHPENGVVHEFKTRILGRKMSYLVSLKPSFYLMNCYCGVCYYLVDFHSCTPSPLATHPIGHYTNFAVKTTSLSNLIKHFIKKKKTFTNRNS